jgi:hypothetical protein
MSRRVVPELEDSYDEAPGSGYQDVGSVNGERSSAGAAVEVFAGSKRLMPGANCWPRRGLLPFWA